MTDRKWLEYLQDMLNTLAGKLTAFLAFALLVIFFIGTFGDLIPQNFIWLVYLVVISAMIMTFILAILEVRAKHQQKESEDGADPPAELSSGQASQSDEPDSQVNQEKLNIYLDGLIRQCQTLPLEPVGGNRTADIDRITLEKIYVDLDVFDKQQDVRLPALDVTKKFDRLVLLGDPGSGKSTFIKMVARRAALDAQTKTENPGLGKQYFPVMIILKTLVNDLSEIDPENLDKDLILNQFEAYIQNILIQNDLHEFEDAFQKTLENEDTLFIFDGMDEVPHALRKQARLWIEAVLWKFKPQKAILTCRIRSYFDEAVLTGVQTYTIAPFSPDQIKDFTGAWYRTKESLTPPQQEERARDFFERIDHDKKILDMATNPLLLTQMAVLHQRDTRLPDQRVKIYEEMVILLLTRWQDHSDVRIELSPRLIRLLNQDEVIRPALEHLAFQSHRMSEGKKTTGDISKDLAKRLLASSEHFGKDGLAEDFLEYLDQRSGLLRGDGGTISQPATYSFPHQTFREYLAACYLNRQSLHKKLTLLAEIAGEGEFWNVVFDLGVEERIYIGKDPDLAELAFQLCEYGSLETEDGHRMLYWSSQLKSRLGDEVILDYDTPTIPKGSEYLAELKEKLAPVSQGILLTPIERADCADTLDELGYLPDDLYTFVPIPSDATRPTFWMGKYPVTNAQYARFLKPENFADRNLWVDFPRFGSPEENYPALEHTGKAGWDWLQKELQDKDNLVEEGVLYPRYWRDTRFGAQRPNAPVVGVSWWEANAYAQWLLSHWEELEEGRQGARLGLAKPALIRLPREDEWVKATCGPDASSPATYGPDAGGEVDERYAFSTLKNPKEEITRYCNTDESGIGRTTPVWTYPQGISPNGVMDMSGNVWEWQGNLYRSGQDWWALRGGSWLDDCRYARVSGRDYDYWVGPRLDIIGFRLVSLPVH